MGLMVLSFYQTGCYLTANFSDLNNITNSGSNSSGDSNNQNPSSPPPAPAPPEPLPLAFNSSNNYFKGSAVNISPLNDITGLSSFSISPALPTGLSLDPTTGVISGTPTLALSETSFTVSANKVSGGTTSAPFSLSVGLNFSVNSNADSPDNNIGDSLCENASGTCTLRAALQELNFWSNIQRQINIPAMTITLSGSELSVTQSVTITGAGIGSTVIDVALNPIRAFNIANTVVEASLSGITIQNAVGPADGGAIISYAKTLNLSSCRFYNNKTSTNGSGGAVTSIHGNLNVSSCAFDNNQAVGTFGHAGAIYVNSGGAEETTANIVSSTFSSNSAGRTASDIRVTGISFKNLTISKSSFEAGTANMQGAIYVNTGTFNIDNSYISSGNVVGALVYVFTASCSATNLCTINQTTIYSTSDPAFTYVGSSSSKEVTISNSTLIGGNAATTGAIWVQGPALHKLTNTIVSNSNVGGSSCGSSAYVISNGYNLSSNTDCGFTAFGDQQGQAHLSIFNTGIPALNGGSTKTVALKAGGPAIDKGPVDCVDTTDQRGLGFLRPINKSLGLYCDVGAFEAQ